MFYLPYLYTVMTRYKSRGKIAVYFITYIFAELLLYGLQIYFAEDIAFEFYYFFKLFITFLIALTSYVNIYELGYIWNDTETIKKESNPTMRLTDVQLNFYEDNKLFIYCERVIVSLLANFTLYFLINVHSLIIFTLGEVVTLIVYAFYNKIRSNFCHFLYFLLVSIRYISITFCYSEYFNFSVFISCLFIFPIIRTMEYKAHYTEGTMNLFFRKYIIKFDVTKITLFRVLGTFSLLLVSILLWLVKICNLMPVLCSFYIFLYRFLLFIAVKLGKEFKGYLKK